MSHRNFVLSEELSGRASVVLRGQWSEEVDQLLRSRAFDKISVWGAEWPDFTALAAARPQVERLHLVGVADIRTTGLEGLTTIRHLNINEPLNGSLDPSVFSQLESAWLYWDKKFSSRFFSLPKLHTLTLPFYSEQSCEALAGATALQRLDLRQGSLRSLAGLEKLTKLRELQLAYIRNLTDVSALKGMLITELRIVSCPKVELSGACPLSVEKLVVEKASPAWDTLDWLKAMPRVRTVESSAEIRKLEWSLVFSHPTLRAFSTSTHRGYTISDDEIRAVAREHGRNFVTIARYGSKITPVISVSF